MDNLRIDIKDEVRLKEAARIFLQEGIVILGNVVNEDYAHLLKMRMDEDSLELLAFCEQMGGNPRREGQLQQSPPPFPPYLSADVLANEKVWKIVFELLGEQAGIVFTGGNTNCPQSQAQSVHLDQAHKNGMVGDITSVILNYAPQDVTTANGAMEIWPGTHTVFADQIVTSEQLEARRRTHPPCYLEMSRKDLVLRDPRLWHRGVTNPSSEFRHVIAAVVHATKKERASFDHAARPFFEALSIPLNPQYDDLKSAYLTQPTLDMITKTRQEAGDPSFKPLVGL